MRNLPADGFGSSPGDGLRARFDIGATSRAAPCRAECGHHRAPFGLWVIVATILVAAAPGRAQEFRIGDWRAYALVGPAGLQAGIQYVSFSGDHGLRGSPPDERAMAVDVTAEAALLSRFDLNVVNLEFPLPGVSGTPESPRIDDVVLQSLTEARFGLVGRANNHALDFGSEGIRYTGRKLAGIGLPIIGERESPVFHWQAGSRRIDICALADDLDEKDPDQLVVMTDEQGLALVRRETKGAAFRIAFVHLGSASRFVSPHERSQAARLVKAGFGLIVCTGSHFIKGFVKEGEAWVAYGIGDHRLSISYADRATEPLGMYLVAGFDGGRLVQVFVVPRFNDVRRAHLGPVDAVAFAEFVKTLQNRSTVDEAKYYSDPGALKALLHGITILPGQLGRLKARHFVYAAKLVVQQRPGWVAATAVVIVVVGFAWWRRRSRRRRMTKQVAPPTKASVPEKAIGEGRE